MLGTVVSVVVGLLSSLLTEALQRANASLETAVFTSIVTGNVIGYIGDIMFAKCQFGDEVYAFGAWRQKLVWLLRSFMSQEFVRFLLTVVIDILFSVTVTSLAVDALDRWGVRFSMRNSLVAGTVSVLTFLLFVNHLRFSYAYADDVPFSHDLIVYAWVSVMVAVFALRKALRPPCEPGGSVEPGGSGGSVEPGGYGEPRASGGSVEPRASGSPLGAPWSAT